MEQAEKEISRLADFLMNNYQREMGNNGLPDGESAVDLAIRLLSK